MPFWHLQFDHLWEVLDSSGRALRDELGSEALPPSSVLNSEDVLGGFSTDVYSLLASDASLLEDARSLILESFPGKEEQLRLLVDGPVATGRTGFWLFQANPAKWSLTEALKTWKVGAEDTWTASRYYKEMRPGDKVALWQGGVDAGIYALAELTSEAFLAERAAFREPSAEGQTDEEWHVRLRLSSILDEPILKRNLADHPLLNHLSILRFAQATNFRLSEEEWRAILELARSTEEAGASTVTATWWVNQGASYRRERDGGYVWAPQETRAGRVAAHHKNVSLMTPGDVVVHYQNMELKALGLVTSHGAPAPRPPELPTKAWGDEGYQASVHYFELANPIKLAEIDLHRRMEEGGPFQADGAIKQGYLYPVSEAFTEYLRSAFADRWPEESPWVGEDGPMPDAQPLDGSFEDLTQELVNGYLEQRQLRVGPAIVASAIAGLRAGKNLILTGPPGTGKTELALALSEAAASIGLSTGVFPTTATADWTSIDTIGGYRLDKNKGLQFNAGCVLEAIDRDAWLIIDEFNRADIDKAVGQLFTVLSGQAVTLPYLESRGNVDLAPSIVPPGVAAPPHTYPHRIDSRWRIIATLNSRDRDLLFNMSYALIRRFAVIDVPNPAPAAFIEILNEKAATGSVHLDHALAELITLPYHPVSPAILIDCGQYLRARQAVAKEAEETPGDAQLLQEALFSYVVPQLDDLSKPQLQEIVAYLQARILKSYSPLEVARLVAAALQTSADDLVPTGATVHAVEDAILSGEEVDGQTLEPE